MPAEPLRSRDRRRASAGWFDGLGYVHRTSMWYSSRVVKERGVHSHALALEHAAAPTNSACLMQRVPGLRTCRVRCPLDGRHPTEHVGRAQACGSRADGDEQNLAFDNMSNHPDPRNDRMDVLHGRNRDPGRYAWINFGVLLCGDGVVVVRDVRLDGAKSSRRVAAARPPRHARAASDRCGRRQADLHADVAYFRMPANSVSRCWTCSTDASSRSPAPRLFESPIIACAPACNCVECDR